MAANVKVFGWGTAAVLLGAGVYLGAQAVVGHEVEKALSMNLQQLDRTAAWQVTDLVIDKSLFSTDATATLSLTGIEHGTATLNLHIDHGVLKSAITGAMHPDPQFVQGVVDIDLAATLTTVKGQLRASSLRGVAVDASVEDLEVNLDLAAPDAWQVDGMAHAFAAHLGSDSLALAAPHFALFRQPSSRFVHQRLESPRADVAVNGINAYFGGVDLQAEAEMADENGLVNANVYASAADAGTDRLSVGSVSLALEAKRWHLAALMALHNADAALARLRREQSNPAAEQAALGQAAESGYALLAASPSLVIEPLAAHVEVPLLGIDYRPELNARVRFDGHELDMATLYSALGTAQPARSATRQSITPLNQAQRALIDKLTAELRFSTPPKLLMEWLPQPYASLLDPARSEQQVRWQAGEFVINGETIL